MGLLDQNGPMKHLTLVLNVLSKKTFCPSFLKNIFYSTYSKLLTYLLTVSDAILIIKLKDPEPVAPWWIFSMR